MEAESISSTEQSQHAVSEPAMFLQRPSSARSQDVTHLLAKTFRELFMHESVGSDTVHYLTKSKGGDDPYHEQYVDKLKKVQEDRDRRMAEAAMLERHIMQSQARAMSADEKALNRMSAGFNDFPDLGLPPSQSLFRSCIDSELLAKHNLITPEDFATDIIPIVPPPKPDSVPSYARQTTASSMRSEKDNAKESPFPDINDDEALEKLSSTIESEDVQDYGGFSPAEAEERQNGKKIKKQKADISNTISNISKKNKQDRKDKRLDSKMPGHSQSNGSADHSEYISLKQDPPYHWIVDLGDILERADKEYYVPDYHSSEPYYLDEVDAEHSSDTLLQEVWKDSMDPEAREVNRFDLNMMQSKIDYTKSARHAVPTASTRGGSLMKSAKRKAKEVNIKAKQEKVLKEPVEIFVPYPKAIVFSDYQISSVYELKLELKNVTSVMRPVRVIPPKTEYFSLGLGQFPDEHGLVAPGMSCFYTVRFAPDSMGDFHDELVVQVQSGIDIKIPVLGRRPPPVLSLPETIELGECLVGGAKLAQMSVTNTGGSGRFVIMPRSQWPATNFKAQISGGIATVPPFQIQPVVFELLPGQMTPLEIMFTPSEVVDYEQQMTMVCDNCQVHHFTIRGAGQTAVVELHSVEGGLSEPELDEQVDYSAQNLIRYEDLNPYTYHQKLIVIQNPINVELPFNWVVVKPNMKPPDDLLEDYEDESGLEDIGEQKRDKEDGEGTLDIEQTAENPECNEQKLETASKQDKEAFALKRVETQAEIQTKKKFERCLLQRIQDESTAFNIEPPTGVLPAGEKMEFMVTFAPSDVKDYHSVLHMILRDIPVVKDMGLIEDIPNPEETDMRGNTPIKSVTSISPKPPAEQPLSQDLTAMEIELKGSCIPFSVILQPYALILPGKCLINTPVKKIFRIVNASISTILFEWEQYSGDYIMQVEPSFGELGPHEDIDLELTVSASKAGLIEHTMLCHIQHQEEPLKFKVKAEAKGPEIKIENSSVNFGLIQLGSRGVQEITINNLSQISTKWSIQQSVNDQKQTCSGEFTFKPACGELMPLESHPVLVSYQPKSVEQLRTVLDLQVQGGECSSVPVFGEVQQPQVCLLSCDLYIPEVYLGMPVTHTVQLLNQTLLPTTFAWQKAEGNQSDSCDVYIEPLAGTIGAREQIDVQVTFTPHKLMSYEDLRVSCLVADMENPIFLNISCNVHGLQVSYHVIDEELDNDEQKRADSIDNNMQSKEEHECEKEKRPVVIDFGSSVPLGSTPMRKLCIRNDTAIPAPYTLMMEYYTARPPTPPAGAKRGVEKQGLRKSMLSTKSASSMDPFGKSPAKAKQELCRAMLQRDTGLAITVHPDSGVLQPFSELVIEITAFSDMWGQYQDRLCCKVADLDIVYIPVNIGVVGNPLNFQIVAASPSQTPILRCGSHAAGAQTVVRTMRINNTSPYDVRVDWQTFNKKTEYDSQLLDLTVYYGLKAFPQLDKKGNEIVLDEDDIPTPVPIKIKRSRASFDYIPDSVDSSPLQSKQTSIVGVVSAAKNDQIIEEVEEFKFVKDEVEQVEAEVENGLVTEETVMKNEQLEKYSELNEDKNDVDKVTDEVFEEIDRVKIVSLVLNPHEGTPGNDPFIVKPRQHVIPARSSSNINVAFTPPNVTTAIDFNSFALGYLTLDQPHAEIEGQVTRIQGYKMEPLRVDMTAQVKPSRLHIETADDENMTFTAGMSDLMQDGMIQPEKFHLSTCTFSNFTQASLTFKLTSQAPFHMVQKKHEFTQTVLPITESNSITLKPQEHAKVEVGFRLYPKLANYLNDLEPTEGLLSSEPPSELPVQYCKKGVLQRLNFHSNLQVEYSTGSTQNVPLYASVNFPAFILSKDVVDFGECLIGQTLEQQVLLTNPSPCVSYWNTLIVNDSESCGDGTFDQMPNGGMLEPHINALSKNTALLTIYFVPKFTETYERKLQIVGQLGEISCELTIKGAGTYDECQEQILDV